MTLLHPTEHLTQAEEFYSRLKFELMTGAHLPGRKLSIRSFSEETGFGSAAVREALKRLASERVLDGGTKRSYLVPKLNDKRAVDLFNLRALLECEAAALALPRIGPGLMPKLRAVAEHMAASISVGEFETYMVENQRFHFLIYDNCGNPDMTAMIEQLWMQTGPSLHQGMLRGSPDASWNRHHLAIIAAFESRDTSALRREMLRDIGWGAEHYTS